MLFANKEELNARLKGVVCCEDNGAKVENVEELRNSVIDDLVYKSKQSTSQRRQIGPVV